MITLFYIFPAKASLVCGGWLGFRPLHIPKLSLRHSDSCGAFFILSLIFCESVRAIPARCTALANSNSCLFSHVSFVQACIFLVLFGTATFGMCIDDVCISHLLYNTSARELGDNRWETAFINCFCLLGSCTCIARVWREENTKVNLGPKGVYRKSRKSSIYQ
ncbi:hypothetical protein CC78DRAFT_138112 [Lojkania enalia]|uniref:Uncharacterized protein n=1 Tax=Lojkania enalia TaxID=147567 RepID=A0A9P4NCS2_9PLEO|nr:hypothetical protein CC78DRAFT_138112 [Didymosphaeria enalia]